MKGMSNNQIILSEAEKLAPATLHETRKEGFEYENLYPPQHCRMGRLHGR